MLAKGVGEVEVISTGRLAAVNEPWGQAGGRWTRLGGEKGREGAAGEKEQSCCFREMDRAGEGRSAELARGRVGEERGDEPQQGHMRPWRWNEELNFDVEGDWESRQGFEQREWHKWNSREGEDAAAVRWMF